MMPIPIILAAEVVENPTFSDSLPHLMGFVVVVVTLAVLCTICFATGMILKGSAAEPSADKPQAVAQPVDDDYIPPETLAVIAAAIQVTAGRGRRIVSVKAHNPAWHSAGRQQIHSSHEIR